MNQEATKTTARRGPKVKWTAEAVKADQARIQPTIDRLMQAFEAGIPVKVIASKAGVDYFRMNQTSAAMGLFYGTGKRHITFTDAELTAINAAIDSIRDSLGVEQ